ncbi:hypothetical protein V8E52_005466 [Russula decolorans]
MDWPSAMDVSRLARALVSSSVKAVIRYHIAAPGARRPRPLPVQILLQLSTYHIEVLPLESGKSDRAAPKRCTHRHPSTAHITQPCAAVSPGGVPRKPILTAEWGMRCCKNKQCTRRELRSLLRHVHRISPAVVGKSWCQCNKRLSSNVGMCEVVCHQRAFEIQMTHGGWETMER